MKISGYQVKSAKQICHVFVHDDHISITHSPIVKINDDLTINDDFGKYKLPISALDDIKGLKLKALVTYAKANQLTAQSNANEATSEPVTLTDEAVSFCPAPAVPAKSTAGSQGILFIDTETTGLGDKDEVIEVSVVDINERVVFHSLVKPTQRIRPSSIRVHGITDQMVRNAPTFVEIFPKLQQVLKGNKCVFYNADFDMPKMAHSYQRSFDKQNPALTKDRLGRFCVGYVGLFKDIEPFCLMRFYQRYKGYRRWVTLMDACTSMYVPLSDLRGHRATDDAKATARLYRALKIKGAL